RNSASASTNFLISQGQATRSTLTRSRVIHFMKVLLSDGGHVGPPLRTFDITFPFISRSPSGVHEESGDSHAEGGVEGEAPVDRPQPAADERGGEDGEAAEEVVQAHGAAARAGGGEVHYERLARRLARLAQAGDD